MLRRACIAAAAAVTLMLLGPAAAQANHGFTVSKTEATAGEEVEFQISGTQAGESYIVRVENEDVASGVDSTGNGVSDKFTMPDFGDADKAVSVEVDITVAGEPNHRGTLSPPMQYLAVAASGGSGGDPAPQPAPVKTVTDPVPPEEVIPSTPPVARDPNPTSEPGSNVPDGNTNNTGTGGSGSDSGTNTTPTAGGSTGGHSRTRTRGSSSLGADITSQVPPGPTGPSAPIGSSIAAALSPLSGLAQPGKTGFPILLGLLIVLLIAIALTASGPRLWQRWEPALPWGEEVDDDMRLGALGRASASGAELQETIAARKASRSIGRAH